MIFGAWRCELILGETCAGMNSKTVKIKRCSLIFDDCAIWFGIWQMLTSFQSHFSAHRKLNGRRILDTVEIVVVVVPSWGSELPESVPLLWISLSSCRALQSVANEHKTNIQFIFQLFSLHRMSSIDSHSRSICDRACVKYQRRQSSNFIGGRLSSELPKDGVFQSISSALLPPNESWQIEQKAIVLFHCVLNQFLRRAHFVRTAFTFRLAVVDVQQWIHRIDIFALIQRHIAPYHDTLQDIFHIFVRFNNAIVQMADFLVNLFYAFVVLTIDTKGMPTRTAKSETEEMRKEKRFHDYFNIFWISVRLPVGSSWKWMGKFATQKHMPMNSPIWFYSIIIAPRARTVYQSFAM